MTSTYDHRIIQGAESGRFLQVVEEYLQGEHGFYEEVFADLGVDARPGAAAAAPAPPPRPPPARDGGARAPPSGAAAGRRGAAAGRPGRDLAGQGAPHARPPRRASSTRSAPSPRATRRSTRSRSASRPSSWPGSRRKILRMYVPGATLADALPHLRETYCGTIAYEIEHIASHRQRVVAAREDRVRRVPHAADQRGEEGAAAPPDAGRRARALHAQGLPRPEAVLDRGPRHDGPDARRDDPALRRQRRARGRHRHGPPRPAQRARPQPRPRLRDDLPRVRGRLHDRGRDDDPAGRHRRRQVPPRRPGHLPAAATASRSSSASSPTRATSSSSRPSSTARRAPRRRRARARTRTSTPTPRCRSSCTATPPSPARASSRRRFNLQALDGYKVGGTLHLIQNNQVGFTTDPDDARSTRWASDLAKGFDVPIIHVNADDVEACISAVRLAFAFRQEFGHDVLIDLIGYRRCGHNEADEPAYTQPEMSAKIKKKTPVREIFAEQLVERGRDHQGGGRRDRKEIWDELADAATRSSRRSSRAAGAEQPTGDYELDRTPSPEVKTAVSADRLLVAQRGAAAGARRLHGPPQARQAARAPARGARPRGRDRLGARRVARLRLAAHRGHAGPPDRPGRRARHVLPAPPRPARPQDRPARLADPEPAGRARADGAAQLAAERDRLPRLRVRLLDGGARVARAVGGPVRRLRQLRAGDHRPVHRLGAGQVGPVLAPDAAAPARLRGLGPRALLRRAWSASSSSPPRATSASPT